MQALEMLLRNPPSQSFREPLREMVLQLSHGATVSDAMKHLGSWVPMFDISLVEAGEHSGRLDQVFKLLATYYEERASLLRQIIGGLLYPMFVFHFAIFLFPFIGWFAGKISATGYVLRTIGPLVILYAATLFIIFAVQSTRDLGWRTWMERLMRPVPVLGAARQYLALSRLAAALEALINAGVTIIEAWDMAAAASGSPAIMRAVKEWKPRVVAGELPSHAINSERGVFPELFANMYFTGETSGQLDDHLKRLHKYYQEEGIHRVRILSRVVPRIIYLCVVLYVAYLIVDFWNGLYGKNSDLRKVLDWGDNKK